jgi:hypothetical protein
MNRRNALAAISLASLAAAQTKKSTIREEFLGAWKLVGFESKNKTTGEVRYPYGTNPVGRITYDQTGRMSAQLMNPGRRKVGGPPARGSAAVIRDMSADDMREILTGFIAYFGTFDVEGSNKTVIHHVEACLIPSWVGIDLRRTYKFSGRNQLDLTVTNDQLMGVRHRSGDQAARRASQ